jgi:hypothetical protein
VIAASRLLCWPEAVQVGLGSGNSAMSGICHHATATDESGCGAIFASPEAGVPKHQWYLSI